MKCTPYNCLSEAFLTSMYNIFVMEKQINLGLHGIKGMGSYAREETMSKMFLLPVLIDYHQQ